MRNALLTSVIVAMSCMPATGRLLGQQDTAETGTDGAVLREVLANVVLRDDVTSPDEMVLVEARTLGPDYLKSLPFSSPPFGTDELFWDLAKRNQTSVPLACDHCPARVVFVEPLEIDAERQDEITTRYFAELKTKYPTSVGTYRFHRPGFSADGETALVHYVWIAGPSAAKSKWVRLKRTSSGWIVDAAKTEWQT